MIKITLGLALALLASEAHAQSVFADHDAVCRSWGTTPGTEAYVQCRMYQTQRRDQKLRDAWRALNSAHVDAPPPVLPVAAPYDDMQPRG
jgi:enamine deaminase RidA (YjgF/YER057c/UK114 family)